MKKLAIILSLLFFACPSSYAQGIFFNDSLRIELKQLLVDKNIATPTGMLNYDPLVIRNLVTMENTEKNPAAGDDKHGIYDFYDKGQFYKFSLILIRNGDEYEILDIINMNRSQIRAKLKNYFHRHPDVSKNLFPVYANALNFLRKEHSLIARTWDIRIEKDDNNNSIYRYIYKPNDSFIEFEEIID